jgi:hypothetical protein
MESKTGDEGITNNKFKALADVLKSDARLDESIIDGPPGQPFCKWTLEVHHAGVAMLALGDSVPRDVRVSWDTTRNLFLYGWFVYRFFDVARLHGATTVEFALRLALEAKTGQKFSEGKAPTLKKLLEDALKHGLIRPAEFTERQRALSGVAQHNKDQAMIRAAAPEPVKDAFPDAVPETEERFIRRILKWLRYIRNTFAHGTFALLGPDPKALEIMRDLINGLFHQRSPDEAPADMPVSPA